MSAEKIPGVPDQYGQKILDLFGILPRGAQVILFGSRAKGNHREGSDIDLALKGAGFSLQDRDRWLLQYDALDLPWKIDLVVYELIEEPALQAHIDRVGKRLLSGTS
jgi:predicted nucleotidyltransferase